MQYHTHTAN